jgi:hypothetical protein
MPGLRSPLVGLCILMSATACRRSIPAPPAVPQETNEVARQDADNTTVEKFDVDDLDISSTYEMASDDAADAVLVVSIHSPAILKDLRFPLKKNAKPAFPGTHSAAKCVCADGLYGAGYVLTVMLSGDSATHIVTAFERKGSKEPSRDNSSGQTDHWQQQTRGVEHGLAAERDALMVVRAVWLR